MKSFYEFYQKMLSEQPAPQQATQAPAAGAQQQQPPAGQQQQQQQQQKPGGATSPPIPDKATQTIDRKAPGLKFIFGNRLGRHQTVSRHKQGGRA